MTIQDSQTKISVMVIGAAGQIGKVLCSYLTTSGFVSNLILNDITCTKGLKAELNHMPCGCKVQSVKDLEDLEKDSKIDMVLMPCGKPQTSPGNLLHKMKKTDKLGILLVLFKGS